jgi:hypothetical protein
MYLARPVRVFRRVAPMTCFAFCAANLLLSPFVSWGWEAYGYAYSEVWPDGFWRGRSCIVGSFNGAMQVAGGGEVPWRIFCKLGLRSRLRPTRPPPLEVIEYSPGFMWQRGGTIGYGAWGVDRRSFPTNWHAAGFQVSTVGTGIDESRRVAIPWWFLTAVFSITPARRFRAVPRFVAAVGRDWCGRCGRDVRHVANLAKEYAGAAVTTCGPRPPVVPNVAALLTCSRRRPPPSCESRRLYLLTSPCRPARPSNNPVGRGTRLGTSSPTGC